MGAADSDIDQGRRRCPYIGTYLLGGGAIGPAIQVRDMSPDAVYEEGVWRIPPQGGPQDDCTANTEGSGWRLGLPTSVGCDGRSGVAGNGDLRIWPPEYSIAIYFD